jgi:hypothetical protein
MHIKPPIIEKYVYVEKANDWIDTDSFHSQQHLVGNVPIENILQQTHWENKLPKPLENYGIPVGLYVMHPPCSRMQGGGIIPKKHDKPPSVINDDDHEKLLKFIHIYTGKSENRVRNKTHKKRS